jgi:hypothetical protein
VARVLEDFITAYLKYTEGTEPPTNFHLWCGISAISAALQRKTYMTWGVETVYPNQYIILIGASGKCRKGVAFGIVQDLVREVGIRATAESITREALIRDIKDSLTNFNDPDRGVKFHSSLCSYQEELSIFLGQADVKFLADLTDWYNCKPKWTYRTKNMGTDEIQGICFNLLGGTAPDWLVSIIPAEAIGGGFTARCIFVVEEEKKCLVPRPKPGNERLRAALIKDLEQIHLICGEMQFTPDAEDMYADWYEFKAPHSEIKDPKFASYNERRATHVKKLAMAMSASRGDDRKITAHDFTRALLVLEKTEVKMPRVFRTLGDARYSKSTMLVLDFIIKHRRVGASQILQKFYMDVDSYALDIIGKTLMAMKVITTEFDKDAKEIIYIYKNKEVKNEGGG